MIHRADFAPPTDAASALGCRRPRVLAYHEFSHQSSRDVYRLRPQAFAAQLSALQAARDLGKAQDPAACLAQITFDDAHRSQVALAAPLLEQAGLRGLFFAPAAWVGARVETAGWADLRALVERGHRVGSHGDTHVLLTHCTAVALARELAGSRQRLEDHLGEAVDSISMPGGRWNAAVAAACLSAGYRVLYTSEPGFQPQTIADGQRTLTIVGRLIVRRTMSATMVASYIAGSALTAMRLRGEYQLKQALKQTLGDARYQAVWRRWLRTPGVPQLD